MTYPGISILAKDLLAESAVFITGTDTSVGKTHVACALLQEFHRRKIRAIGFKPICCGNRQDALKFQKLSSGEMEIDFINPIHLPQPMAPASQPCPAWTDLIRRIRKARIQLIGKKNRILLTEGAGGLLCPITHRHTMRELAVALKMPLLLVIHNRLGMLNHTLLTLEAAKASGLKCFGLVVTHFGKKQNSVHRMNLKILKSLTSIPVYVV